MRKGVTNGVVIVPAGDFEVSSEWYYMEIEGRKGEFSEITCHNVRAKFHKYPSDHSVGTKFDRTDITS
jgi:hypothetical protein